MPIQGHIGADVPPEAEPGESMRGVDPSQPSTFATEAGGTAGKFPCKVDSENKATEIQLFSVAQPHMRAFHLMWFSFFISFVSTFAASPMIAIVREDIGLNKAIAADAGIAAVTGTIFARIVMGSVCDTFGPRYGHAFLMLGSAPAVFLMSLAKNGTAFIAFRCMIGFSLATFVATQFWSSIMFTPKIVGIANATTAGWGNLGGGITNLVMPFIYTAFLSGYPSFTAWRLAYYVPGWCHILVGVLVLFFSQDLPDGTYSDLRKSGKLPPADPGSFAWGCKNYRMWLMTVQYGYCFGVELTMNNVAAPYFYDHFGVDLRVAGILGSCFGLMNIFARSLGGWLSDLSAKKAGMRGRLWTLWITQTMEGVMCVLMGLSHESLAVTLVFMILFSTFVQAAEGASYGVVPFISKRSLGVVSGFIGAGGNAGSSVTQSIFFKTEKLETYEGIMYMGIMIIAVTAATVIPIHFPMWGSMFMKGDPSITEEEYYTSDYTEQEKAEGKHKFVLKFAENSKTQRAPQPGGTPEEAAKV